MPQEILYYILLFFVGSILGWCMEVLCKLWQFHRFINRGFLMGPWCPIYGCGTALLTALLSRFTQDPFAVFGLAMLICGTLEYLTSYLMEVLFHARWWDYSSKRFNLNGRVCANTLIPFGLLGLGMIYFVKPFLFGQFARLDERLLNLLCAGLAAIFLTDAVISTLTLIKIRKGASRAEGDSTEAITAAVRSALALESAQVRRILHAFPESKIYNSRVARQMRERRRLLRQEMKAARQRAKEAVNEREKKLKAEIKERKRKLGK